MDKWTTSLVALALGVLGLVPTGSVRAGFINFDVDAAGNPITAPTTFAEATALTDLYASLGVHFSGPGGNNGGAILNDANFAVKALSGRNFLAFDRTALLANGGTPTDPESVAFDSLQSEVSIFVTPRTTTASQFRLDAFDEGGTLIGSNTVIFGEGFGVYQRLRVTSPQGIRRVTLTQTLPNGSASFTYDNLAFISIVPEPSTLALLTLGIPLAIGLAWLSRGRAVA
jgi:hypothetical protein